MALPRPRFLRRDVALDHGKGDGAPEQAHRALKRTLKSNARQAGRAGDKPTELCLIGHAPSDANYRAIRTHWVRKARGWAAERWPERLPGERYALFRGYGTQTAPRPPGPSAPGRVSRSSWIFTLDLPPESVLAIGVGVCLRQVAVHLFDAVAFAPDDPRALRRRAVA